MRDVEEDVKKFLFGRNRSEIYNVVSIYLRKEPHMKFDPRLWLFVADKVFSSSGIQKLTVCSPSTQ